MDSNDNSTVPPAVDGMETNPPLESGAVPSAGGNVSGADDAFKLAAEHGAESAGSGKETSRRRDRVRKWKKTHPGQTHPEEHLLPPAGARPSFTARTVVRKEPPPIPSLAPAENAAGSAESIPAIDAVGGSGDSEIDSILAWTPEEVAEITDELVEGLEEWDKLDDVKCAKLAKLAPKLIEQIEADATMPKITKKILLKFLPKFVARKLNEAKVNPVKSDGALLTLALTIYGYDKFSRRRAIVKEGKLNGVTVTKTEEKP